MIYSVQSQPAGEPKLKALQKRRLYSAIATGLVLAVAGGAALKLTTSVSTDRPEAVGNAVLPGSVDSAVEAGNPLTPMADAKATPFRSPPFLAASGNLRLADPSLLRSTSPQARIDTVVAGRPDPFAAVILPATTDPRPRPTASLITPPPPTPGTVALPVVPTAAALPPLPAGATQPAAPPSLPLPALPGVLPPTPADLAVFPTGAPTFENLVDQIVISGVVQMGSTVSVIVNEPGSTVSRRVSQGDVLAGGRIRVKAVDMSGQEPAVVLTYDGRDYTRTVGAALVSAL